ncbi:hypothetical protein JHK85_032658 [Glycine max]|nr:hypothetical protein JHK85_032658 [Glycine max]
MNMCSLGINGSFPNVTLSSLNSTNSVSSASNLHSGELGIRSLLMIGTPKNYMMEVGH